MPVNWKKLYTVVFTSQPLEKSEGVGSAYCFVLLFSQTRPPATYARVFILFLETGR